MGRIEARAYPSITVKRLNDSQKWLYYSKTVTKFTKQRQRTEAPDSRRAFSFVYNFAIEEKVIRVCKKFYLNTLCISQQRINYFFKETCTQTGLVEEDK